MRFPLDDHSLQRRSWSSKSVYDVTQNMRAMQLFTWFLHGFRAIMAIMSLTTFMVVEGMGADPTDPLKGLFVLLFILSIVVVILTIAITIPTCCEWICEIEKQYAPLNYVAMRMLLITAGSAALFGVICGGVLGFFYFLGLAVSFISLLLCSIGMYYHRAHFCLTGERHSWATMMQMLPRKQ